MMMYYVKSDRIRSFIGPYFLAFGLNLERYSVFFRIQSKYGNILSRKTPNMDTLHAGKCRPEKLRIWTLFTLWCASYQWVRVLQSNIFPYLTHFIPMLFFLSVLSSIELSIKVPGSILCPFNLRLSDAAFPNFARKVSFSAEKCPFWMFFQVIF